MKRTLVISDRAHQDIERNVLWWAGNNSLTQAIEWQNAVYDQLETIPQLPESYPLASENLKFAYEIREKNVGLSVGGYRAVFTIHGDQIHILTIRRAAQRGLRPEDLG